MSDLDPRYESWVFKSESCPFGCRCDEAAAEIASLRAALRLFVGCAYAVSTEINPRGHAWRPEGSLDYAYCEALKALGGDEQKVGK